MIFSNVVMLLLAVPVSLGFNTQASNGRRVAFLAKDSSVCKPGILCQQYERPLPGWCLSATADDVVSSSSAPAAELDAMFKASSDKDGSMTKASLMALEEIKNLLDDGDLLESELNEIWGKFADNSERVNFGSFVRIYRAIDDLFEGDGDEKNSKDPNVVPEKKGESSPLADEEEKIELEKIFSVISNEGLLSKQSMRDWDEIETLIVDGILGEDEFQELWDACPKEDSGSLDLEGFMNFNSNLDNLFDFDYEFDEEGTGNTKPTTFANTKDEIAEEDKVVEKVDLFSALAGDSGLVRLDDLSKWDELSEMLDEGEITKDEVVQMFSDALKKSSDAMALDNNAFAAMKADIDDLFEDEGIDSEEEVEPEPVQQQSVAASEFKEDLLRALDLMKERTEDEGRLPCGLESTEREDKVVLNLANQLVKDKANVVLQKQGNIEMDDLTGSWELLFTSSAAMKFNNGLSGIGGSIPNGRFGGLKQKLVSSKFISDAEYKERIAVKPDIASFDVTVDCNWEIRRSVSLFTGEPSTVLAVEPQRVMYGPTSTRADHWKSLGPTNIMDLVYLDDDLRIQRGSTSVNTILIFQRIEG
eukprot:CAMPEP_0198151444 /NCGR_PEP_ID=MMETSP1443-20131203/55550_1 /TAXON_ID=186043 /ORGANISM="Entomoneis sp., Strain CCMP2396" /LENGTH=587 /DNA_ID=CAMNT_0043817099 /DNA_START=207 /DNA_END=1970 /DNA_ORIENTATION=-